MTLGDGSKGVGFQLPWLFASGVFKPPEEEGGPGRSSRSPQVEEMGRITIQVSKKCSQMPRRAGILVAGEGKTQRTT